MSLLKAIITRVRSIQDMDDYPSPPPEIDSQILKTKKKKPVFRYHHVGARVDTSPPRLDRRRLVRHLSPWGRDLRNLMLENMEMVIAIRKNHFTRGRVDSRWERPLPRSDKYYRNRVHYHRIVYQQNLQIYQRLSTAGPKVVPTKELERDWQRNRQEILQRAQAPFILFQPVPQQDIEDPAFLAPAGVTRPRVSLTLRIRDGAQVGVLRAELFTDVCPRICELFTELLAGDGVGFGYVGTCFFRKVPKLYWSGGDVAYDNGFGCYAQRGRTIPISAEKFHFSHSMPGLLSMRVTSDDLVCGIFNITFKSLPQFDLKNVVFGRIIRPSPMYEVIRKLGSPLTPRPVIEVCATRVRIDGRWVCGQLNTRIAKPIHNR